MRENQEEPGRLVAEVVRAAGGSVYGRVRLQKMFYLIDRIGLGSGLDYEYHHYGPYSAELTEEIKDAVAFGFIHETPARRVSDGVPYSIFERPTVELGAVTRGARPANWRASAGPNARRVCDGARARGNN
jgi:hypothetical protein